MNLDNNALLKSAGIGAGVALVLSLLTLIPLVGIACCCLIWVAYVGTGGLYGVFARQNGASIEPGPMALGGAIAAAVAGIVRGIVGGIVSLVGVASGSAMQAMQQLSDAGIDVPPEVYQMYAGGAGIGILAALMQICFGIFLGAVLGAIGGAIYGATQRSSAPPPAPAAM